MAVSTIMEERNKRKRSDTLIDMDLLPRSERQMHLASVSGTSKYQPYLKLAPPLQSC
jgi:hypothetical protein